MDKTEERPFGASIGIISSHTLTQEHSMQSTLWRALLAGLLMGSCAMGWCFLSWDNKGLDGH